jgi:hypothetical protein
MNFRGVDLRGIFSGTLLKFKKSTAYGGGHVLTAMPLEKQEG